MRWLDARFELQPPDALEGPLRDHPLAGDRVAYHAEPEHLDGDQRQDGAQDQRLDVPASVAVEDPVEQEGRPGDQRGDGERTGDDREHP